MFGLTLDYSIISDEAVGDLLCRRGRRITEWLPQSQPVDNSSAPIKRYLTLSDFSLPHPSQVT